MASELRMPLWQMQQQPPALQFRGHVFDRGRRHNAGVGPIVGSVEMIGGELLGRPHVDQHRVRLGFRQNRLWPSSGVTDGTRPTTSQ